MYAKAFKNPPTVPVRPYSENLRGTMVISITFIANMQFVTPAMHITDIIAPADFTVNKIIKNIAEIPKNTADVKNSFLIFLLIAFAKYAPVTLIMGSSIVSRRENPVVTLYLLFKNVGIH